MMLKKYEVYCGIMLAHNSEGKGEERKEGDIRTTQ